MLGIDILGCRVDFVLGGFDWVDSVFEEFVNGIFDCGNGFVIVVFDWEDGWVFGIVLGVVVGILGWKIGWFDGWGIIVFGIGFVVFEFVEDGIIVWGVIFIYDCGFVEGSGKFLDEVIDCVGGNFIGFCFGVLFWGGFVLVGFGNWVLLGGCEGGIIGWIFSCLDFVFGLWF